MMKKNEIRDLLSAYIDGELSEMQQLEVSHAVETDSDLAAEVGQLRQVSQLIAGLSHLRAPASLAGKIIRKAQVSQKTRVGFTAWYKPVVAAAAVLILAGVASYIIKNPSPPQIPNDKTSIVEVQPLVIYLTDRADDPNAQNRRLAEALGRNSLMPEDVIVGNDGIYVRINVPVVDAKKVAADFKKGLGHGATVRSQTEIDAQVLASGKAVAFHAPTEIKNDDTDKVLAVTRWLTQTRKDKGQVETILKPASKTDKTTGVRRVKPLIIFFPPAKRGSSTEQN